MSTLSSYVNADEDYIVRSAWDSCVGEQESTSKAEDIQDADAWNERFARLDRLRTAVDAVPTEWPRRKDRTVVRNGMHRETRTSSVSQLQATAAGSGVHDPILAQRRQGNAKSGISGTCAPQMVPRSAWDEFLDDFDQGHGAVASNHEKSTTILDRGSADRRESSLQKASSQASMRAGARRSPSADSRRACTDKGSPDLLVCGESLHSVRNSVDISQVLSSPGIRSECNISAVGSVASCSRPSSSTIDLNESVADSLSVRGSVTGDTQKSRASRPPRTPVTRGNEAREASQKTHQTSQTRSPEPGDFLSLSGVGYSASGVSASSTDNRGDRGAQVFGLRGQQIPLSRPSSAGSRPSSAGHTSISSRVASSRTSRTGHVARSATPGTRAVAPNGFSSNVRPSRKASSDRNPIPSNRRVSEPSSKEYDLLGRLNELRAEAHRMATTDSIGPSHETSNVLYQSSSEADDVAILEACSAFGAVACGSCSEDFSGLPNGAYQAPLVDVPVAWHHDVDAAVDASQVVIVPPETVARSDNCDLVSSQETDAVTGMQTRFCAASEVDSTISTIPGSLSNSQLTGISPLLRFLRRAGLEDLHHAIRSYLTDDFEALLNMSDPLIRRLPIPRVRLQRLLQVLATERGCRRCSWSDEWRDVQNTRDVLRRATSVEKGTKNKSDSLEMCPAQQQDSYSSTCWDTHEDNAAIADVAAVAPNLEILQDSVLGCVKANGSDEDGFFITEFEESIVRNLETGAAGPFSSRSIMNTPQTLNSVEGTMRQNLDVAATNACHPFASSLQSSHLLQMPMFSSDVILPLSETPSVLRPSPSKQLLSAEIGQSSLARPKVREARIKELLRALQLQKCPFEVARVEDRQQAAYERHMRHRSRSPSSSSSISGPVLAVRETFRRSRSLMDLVAEQGSDQRVRPVDPVPPDRLDDFVARLPLIPVLEGRQDRCAICLELPRAGEVVISLPCCHLYHLECIREWFAYSQLCPLCKGPAFSDGTSTY